MTSKNSVYNLSLWKIIKEDIRHKSWLTALSLLGSFIAGPVCFLLANSVNRNTIMLSADNPAAANEQYLALLGKAYTRYLTGSHFLIQMLLLVVMTILLSIFGFRYLYSRRMTDLYHSMPLKRSRLFWAVYIDGFFIWFVPCILGNFSVLAMVLFRLRQTALLPDIILLMVKGLLLLLLSFFVVYNASLVPVMISGNAKNAFFNILVYGLIFLGLHYSVVGFAMVNLNTLYLPSDWFRHPATILLSPLAAPFYLFNLFSSKGYSGTAPTLYGGMSWSLCILLLLVIAVLNLLLAGKLYQKRPSELSEKGVDNKWFAAPARFLTSIVAGLLLSLLFYAMLSENSLNRFLFGSVFGCLLCFAIINILYHGSFKALFYHKLQFLFTALVSCSLVFLFYFDLAGYDSYLPDKADIQWISVYGKNIRGNDFGLQKQADGTFTWEQKDSISVAPHYTDQEKNYRLLSDLVLYNRHRSKKEQADSMNDLNREHSYSLTVKVQTSRGSYIRNYTCYAESMEESLTPYIENDAYRDTFYPVASGNGPLPSKIEISSLNDDTHTITSQKDIERIQQAYQKDFREHYSFSSVMYNTSSSLVLFYQYPLAVSNQTEYSYAHMYMRVPYWYQNTIAVLKDLYPDSCWQIQDADIRDFKVSVNEYCTAETLQYLAQVLYQDNEMPSALQERLARIESGETALNEWLEVSFTKTIKDRTQLEQLQKNLCNGYYNGANTTTPSYLYLGEAECMNANDTFLSIGCYIAADDIPEDFGKNLEYEEPDYDSDYYYDWDYYYDMH